MDFKQKLAVDIIESAPEAPNQAHDVRYAISLFRELPLYELKGSQQFAEFLDPEATAPGVLLHKLDPFILMPIKTKKFRAPHENLSSDGGQVVAAGALQDNSVNTAGFARTFEYTAAQNAQKFLSHFYNEEFDYGCRVLDSLQGMSLEDARMYYSRVTRIREIPEVTRTYGGTSRTGRFLDQVVKNLEKRDDYVGLTPEQVEIAEKLRNELLRAAAQTINSAENTFASIVNDIKEGHRRPFSFAREYPDSPYPLDFWLCAHLNKPEPNVMPGQVQITSAANAGGNDALAQALTALTSVIATMQPQQAAKAVQTAIETIDTVPDAVAQNPLLEKALTDTKKGRK